MVTKAQVRWLEQQPLSVKLSAVEKVWQQRADRIVFVADQLWGADREQDALDTVVEFAESAAGVYESIGEQTDFGRFGRQRIRCIAENTILTTAVVPHIVAGLGEGLDTESLTRVCERLGIVVLTR